MTQSVQIKGSGLQVLGDGNLYSAGVVDLSLAAPLVILLRTINRVTLVIAAAVGASCTVELFEGPTSSADGSALARVNHNRVGTPRLADTLAFTGPTTSADVTPLGDRYIPAGSGGNAPGGDAESGAPFLLAAATDYLIRLTAVAGTPEIDLHLYWAE